jgi:hypothetical protein
MLNSGAKRLILFSNTFFRCAFGKSLCSDKSCWKLCIRASAQVWAKSTYRSLSAQLLSECIVRVPYDKQTILRIPNDTIQLVMYEVWLVMLLRDKTFCKKAIPLRAWTGPESSRWLSFPNFNTTGTWRWQGCHPYAPAPFTPRKDFWFSFLLEAEITPGPKWGLKDYANEKFQRHNRESNPRPSGL